MEKAETGCSILRQEVNRISQSSPSPTPYELPHIRPHCYLKMKYATFSTISVLALAALGGSAAPVPSGSPIVQSDSQGSNGQSQQTSNSQGSLGSQYGSAGGYGGSATATQDNDYSQVQPGNQVSNGGSQSAQLQGQAGSVLQSLQSLMRRQEQAASAAGYAGTASATQDNDDSQVAPGNQVSTGGSQSFSNQGTLGSVSQSNNLLGRQVHDDIAYIQRGPVHFAGTDAETKGHCLPHYAGLGLQQPSGTAPCSDA